MKTEQELAHIATWSESDEEANLAMQELRERFDKSYTWCEDCDGLVVKESECCNNTTPTDGLEDLDWE